MRDNQAIYLIPLPIAEGALQTLSPEITNRTKDIKHFFAEDLRTGRRFIKTLHPTHVMDTIAFAEIDKHNGPDKNLFINWLKAGHDVGIMSDAGCPGIADPGAELVAIAHGMNIKVVPLTGPSSILLALMASGLNGQSFAFNGYLPVKEPQRSKRIKELEQHSARENQTQVFIETPYRNNSLLADLLKTCNPSTRICIAQNITAPNELIKTQAASAWKKQPPALAKTPAIFLILA